MLFNPGNKIVETKCHQSAVNEMFIYKLVSVRRNIKELAFIFKSASTYFGVAIYSKYNRNNLQRL